MIEYSVASLKGGQSINFGARPKRLELDGRHSFTLAMWIRLATGGARGTMLGRRDQLGIRLDHTRWSVAFSDQTAPLVASVELSVGRWQYLVVTFAAGEERGGRLSMYVDGMPVGSVDLLDVRVDTSEHDLVLGGAIEAEVLSVCVWSIARTPQQAEPQWAMPPKTDPGLLAAYCFCTGRAADVSGNGNPIAFENGAHQLWVDPCLSLQGFAYALPSNQDGVAPGNDGADSFTIHGWVHLRPPLPASGARQFVLFANGTSEGPGLHCLLEYDETGRTFRWGVRRHFVTDPPLMSTKLLALDRWHHVAVTYDGPHARIALYVDGERAGDRREGDTLPTPHTKLAIGALVDPEAVGTAQGFLQGGIQALGVWNKALSDAEVVVYMREDPSSLPECTAFYRMDDGVAANVVTGSALRLVDGAAISEVRRPLDASAPVAVHRAVELTPEQTAAADFRAMALAQADAPAGAGSLLSPEQVSTMIAAFDEELETHARGAPAELCEALRERFARNLKAGLRLVGDGSKPTLGAISYAKIGTDYVYHVETRAGQKEIGRIPEESTDPCVAWIIALVAQCFAMVFSVLGVAFQAGGVVRGITEFLARNQGARLVTAIRLIAASEKNLSLVPVRILQTISQAGGLARIVSSGLAGVSWWDWAFTVATVLLSIAGMWLTGGLYLVWVLAQLALSIAQLVRLFELRPANC